jgi:bcr-type benzoyl-CoA reductase subunit D
MSNENIMQTATLTAGLDVGSGAVKAVVMGFDEGNEELLAKVSTRIRRRDINDVVDEVFRQAIAEAGAASLNYVATTGEGEDIPFATGHFYGMTTHARGALFLDPRASAVLDAGALHARAMAMDNRGRVLNYKMTSQCASGSGQFLENIARYLGVSQAEIGGLSLSADNPEKCSGICAVLAETDVINMVSRGISTENILRGIHESMSGRFTRLLRSLDYGEVIFMTGGLAGDEGLVKALADEFAGLKNLKGPVPEIVTHPDSIFAGAIGAAIWGNFRHGKLGLEGPAWSGA